MQFYTNIQSLLKHQISLHLSSPLLLLFDPSLQLSTHKSPSTNHTIISNLTSSDQKYQLHSNCFTTPHAHAPLHLFHQSSKHIPVWYTNQPRSQICLDLNPTASLKYSTYPLTSKISITI
jgi:hypothetical protein